MDVYITDAGCWVMTLAETGTSTYYVGEPYLNRYSVSMHLEYDVCQSRVIGRGFSNPSPNTWLS